MLIKNNYLLVFIRVLSISETINTVIKNFSGQLHWLSCLTRSKKKMFVFIIWFANKYFILKSMKLIPSQAISIKPLLNRRLEPFLRMYLQINQYLSSKIRYSSFSVKERFFVCVLLLFLDSYTRFEIHQERIYWCIFTIWSLGKSSSEGHHWGQSKYHVWP